MKLLELLKGMDFEVINGICDIDINGIACDSRKTKKDFLFVCIKGYETDGHKYIESAINNGVTALLVSEDITAKKDITIIKINDTRYGLAHVSAAFYHNPSKEFPLIGITGTKGKTTSTYMIKSILEENSYKTGLIGTNGNMIGNRKVTASRTTPESYELQLLFDEMKEEKVDAAVMEVSSQGLALHRVSCVDYDIGVFTNFSEDHIAPNEHTDMEDYLNAKLKLFKMCKKALINIDCAYAKHFINASVASVLTYGINNKADIYADNIVTKAAGVSYTIHTPWWNGGIEMPIPGLFNIYNSLAAIGACSMLGIDKKIIQKGIQNVKVTGRAELIHVNEKYTIMIDYAHNPDSLENILKTVKEYSKGRVVCVFGCGGDRDMYRRPIMGKISGEIADFTIITSDNPRTEEPQKILRDIEEGIKEIRAEYVVIEDRTKAIEYAIKNAKQDDNIILAGKGHETYQIFKDKVIHYDEREIVAELLENLR